MAAEALIRKSDLEEVIAKFTLMGSGSTKSDIKTGRKKYAKGGIKINIQKAIKNDRSGYRNYGNRVCKAV